MATLKVQKSVEGYTFIVNECCRSRLILNRTDIGLLNAGNSLTRSCAKCGVTHLIKGKVERSYAEKTLSLL